MSKFPSLPLFTDAWVADTKHLTRLERGTYHDLIVLMWRSPECRVPNDDAWLAKRLGMTLDEVRDELRPIIAEFIQTDGNWLTQKRLRKEWDWCKKNSKQRSGAAKSRWDKEKTLSKRNANTDTPRNAPILSSPIEDSEANASAPAARRAAMEPVEVVDEEPKAKLFRLGKTILVSFGVAEKRTGSLIGQWLKQRDDPAGLLAAIQFARDQNVAEPVAYISTVISNQKKRNGNAKSDLGELAFELADQLREREFAAGLERPPTAV